MWVPRCEAFAEWEKKQGISKKDKIKKVTRSGTVTDSGAKYKEEKVLTKGQVVKFLITSWSLCSTIK